MATSITADMVVVITATMATTVDMALMAMVAMATDMALEAMAMVMATVGMTGERGLPALICFAFILVK